MVCEVLVEGKGPISSKLDFLENGERRIGPSKLEVVVGGWG